MYLRRAVPKALRDQKDRQGRKGRKGNRGRRDLKVQKDQRGPKDRPVRRVGHRLTLRGQDALIKPGDEH